MPSPFRADRPAVGDYAPYYDKYVSRVPEGDIVATLAAQWGETLKLLKSISETQAMFAYAPGKWNIKELMGHVVDAERLFSFRALWFAREAGTPMPSMEQDDWVKVGGHASRTWESIVVEYDHLRISTLDLFGSFDNEAWLRRGIASNYEVSVRGLAWIIAGHELHHVEILKTKYINR